MNARTLPVLPLESLRVASPCQASWEAMVGDDRRRFCGECNRHVFNLSGLARAEAEALVQGAAETGDRLCARYFVRADGTVLTADCPVGLRAARRRLAAVGAALTSLLGVVGGLLGWRASSGCDDGGRGRSWFAPEPPRAVIMGRIALPPRPTPPPPPPSPSSTADAASPPG